MDIDDLPTIDQLSEADQKDVLDMLNGEGRYTNSKDPYGGGLAAKSITKIIQWAKKKCQRLAVYSAVEPFGIVRCVTCPASHVYNSSRIHGGHVISAKKSMRTALMMENILPQCEIDNSYENGRADKFREYVGDWLWNWLHEEAKKPNPWNAESVAIYMNQTINPGLAEAKKKIKKMVNMVHTHGARSV